MTRSRHSNYALFAGNADLLVSEGGVTRSTLLDIARRLAAQITQPTPNSPVDRLWLVAVNEPIDFAATLIGCWFANVIPVITADLQQDALRSLHPAIEGILTDIDIATDNLPVIHLSGEKRLGDDTADTGDARIDQTIENPVFQADATALVLFTSGSTGDKKRIDKPFFALFEEVKNLQRQFGAQVDGLPRRSTVSHFHIYGFLFNIFWPLHFGHHLCAPSTFYWEQILIEDDQGACIVSSPAHLRLLCGIAQTHPFAWSKSIIFSSGGPLDKNISLEIQRTIGIAPIEIFGSTETGGIAMRQQAPANAVPFMPFFNVQLRRNDKGGMEVASPWVGHTDKWIETGDRIELTDNGAFFIQGRYDTIVKIAGKRVSLTEMEKTCRDMPEIEEVRIIQYQDELRESRGVLAAIVVLSADIEIPQNAAKRKLVQQFKTRLKRRFDLVTLPRYWRFVAALPHNQQGKVTRQLLEETVRDGH